jgi:inorganic pyrophosphatase
VKDLEPETREELQKFFIATDELEAKQLSFLGWGGAKKARQLIKRSAAKFAKG